MAHPNEEIVRKGYAAFSTGDMEALAVLLAPDLVWHALGRNPLSGDYRGVDQSLGFLGRLVEMTGGTLRVEVHDVLANDQHGAALVRSHAERAGRTYDANEAHVFHIRDGLVTEFWPLSSDQQALDDLMNA
jgi:ketosteroid isomerase-like protein